MTSKTGGTAFLVLDGLVRHFGATRALDGADLAISPGSVHALVGENGAGKSTLIKVLSGLYRPGSGTIRLDGRPIEIADPRAAEGFGFRFIHQELNLVPHFDVVGNAWIGRPHPKRGPFLDRRVMRRRVAEVAARIAPDLPLDRAAIHLSPGQRQMAEIVRALMSEARLIVMDEPTSSLSEGEAERLHATVRRLADDGCSVLFISHRLDEVIELCDAYTVLRNGRTVGAGRIADIDRAGLVSLMSGEALSVPNVPLFPLPSPPPQGGREQAAAFMPASDKPARSPSAVPDAEWQSDGQHSSQAAPSMPAAAKPAPPLRGRDGEGVPGKSGEAAAPRFSADIAFGPAEERLAITASAGEIVGLYGLVGAGRSSLLKMLWGATPARGSIRLDDRPLPPGPAGRIAAGVAFVPEDRKREGLAMPLSIESNLALAHLADFRAASRLPLPSRGKVRAFAERTGARLKLVAAGPDRSPATLSGGNQQKLLFGRWLGRPIRLALIDEPTRGVDVGAKAAIHAEIRRIATEGAAVLVATSDMEELVALSDRVVVLHAGRLVAELAGASLTREAIVAAAFGHAPAGATPARSEPAA